MFKHLLVPVDFSDSSRKALELAVRMVAEQDARLTVVHVVMPPAVYTTEIGLAEVGPLFLEVADELREAARKHLEGWVEEVVPEAMPRALVVRQGYPPDEIVQEAAESGADLVVMGAHGHRGLRGVLLGSNTRRVLRNCSVPVLITR